jgi:hypothetical protein
MTDDLAQLREQYPGWSFGTVWATAATGPDYRRVWAQRETILITSHDAAELGQQIEREAQERQ